MVTYQLHKLRKVLGGGKGVTWKTEFHSRHLSKFRHLDSELSCVPSLCSDTLQFVMKSFRFLCCHLAKGSGNVTAKCTTVAPGDTTQICTLIRHCDPDLIITAGMFQYKAKWLTKICWQKDFVERWEVSTVSSYTETCASGLCVSAPSLTHDTSVIRKEVLSYIMWLKGSTNFCLSCSPQFHYLIHTTPKWDSILSKINPVQDPLPHFHKIHFNIIIPSTKVRPQKRIILFRDCESNFCVHLLFAMGVTSIVHPFALNINPQDTSSGWYLWQS